MAFAQGHRRLAFNTMPVPGTELVVTTLDFDGYKVKGLATEFKASINDALRSILDKKTSSTVAGRQKFDRGPPRIPKHIWPLKSMPKSSFELDRLPTPPPDYSADRGPRSSRGERRNRRRSPSNRARDRSPLRDGNSETAKNGVDGGRNEKPRPLFRKMADGPPKGGRKGLQFGADAPMVPILSHLDVAVDFGLIEPDLSERGKQTLLRFKEKFDPMTAEHFDITKLEMALTQFEKDGKTFGSAQQLYYYNLAEHFADRQAAADILAANTAQEAEDIAGAISAYRPEAWFPEPATSVMMQVLALKFGQNRRLMRILNSTRGATIIECTDKEVFWGCALAPTKLNYLAILDHEYTGRNYHQASAGSFDVQAQPKPQVSRSGTAEDSMDIEDGGADTPQPLQQIPVQSNFSQSCGFSTQCI